MTLAATEVTGQDSGEERATHTADGPTSDARFRVTSVGWLRYLVGAAAAVVLLVIVVPKMSGVPWRAVATVMVGLSPGALLLLLVLWLGGLLAHTFTLAAALPGLTRRRALLLSLTGSAVSNVLPVGGAAGIALNYRMTKDWGFSKGAFVAYTVVTNAWDVMAKLALPLIAFPWLVLTAHLAFGHVLGVTAGAAGVVVGGSLLGLAVLANPTMAGHIGSGLDRSLDRVARLVGSRWRGHVRDRLLEVQQDCSGVVRSGWRRMTLSMAVYELTLVALLWLCLHLAGAGQPVVAVFAGFAVERVLTLAGLTPGGAGVVEVGLAGTLLALGGSPTGVVTGVLLYRALTFGIEIPVGAVTLAAWLWLRASARPTGEHVVVA